MKSKKPKWKFKAFTEDEILRWYGKRCKVQQAGCPVCEAWTRFDFINHMKWQDANTRIQLERGI